MAIFPLGAIIKNRREELGLTQEDLADGVCSVPTLSRIENGERIPTNNHMEMLMQRLGYSAMSIDYFADRNSFQLHELKFKIRQAYMFGEYQHAKQLHSELTNIYNTQSKIDTQFYQLYRILLDQEAEHIANKKEKLESALKLTCLRYKQGSISKVLSYEEIILLNNIAICYAEEGNISEAISILSKLKDYYASQIINTEEAVRTQLMVYYNLSKYLGQSGRYDECIDICNLGIRIARKTGHCLSLHLTFYNHAWALIKRNDDGDIDKAQKSLERAIAMADALGFSEDHAHMVSYYNRIFKKSE